MNMKKTKTDKCLCLLLAVLCLMLFAVSLTRFTVNADGTTNVTAHIEMSFDESSQPVSSDGDSSVESNTSDVSTGDTTSFFVAVPLLLLIISVLVICLCNKNYKNNCGAGCK